MTTVSPDPYKVRSFSRGTLRADGDIAEVRFVTRRETGSPAVPLGKTQLEADELVLFLPDDRFGALEVLVEQTPLEGLAAEISRDRYLAYHRRVDSGRFAELAVVSGRADDRVFDGDQLAGPSPIAAAEPALCKRLNADPDGLRALTHHLAGGRGLAEPPSEALCVGVDGAGADVRIAFEVVRIEWPKPVTNRADAEAMIDALLRAEGGDLRL